MYMLLARDTLSERTLLLKMRTWVSTRPWAMATVTAIMAHNITDNVLLHCFIASHRVVVSGLTMKSEKGLITAASTHQQIDGVGYIGSKEDETLDAVKLVALEREHYHVQHECRNDHHDVVPRTDIHHHQRLDR